MKIRIKNKVYAQWKDTPYYCDEEGNVYRKWSKQMKPLVAYPKASGKRKGTYIVHLCLNYKRIEVRVAKMMWEAFYGEVPEGYCVTHKNGAKSMNDLYNLKLTTISETCKISGGTGRRKYVMDMKTRKIYKSAREAGRVLGVSGQTICDTCNKKHKSRIVDVRWYERGD